MAKVPTYDTMLNPLLRAVKELGGSGTIEEIENRVADLMSLSSEQLEVLQDPNRPGRTKFQYRLAWARTYLRRYGVLENSARGVWAVTALGRSKDHIDEKEVVRAVKAQLAIEKEESPEDDDGEVTPVAGTWRDQLIEVLLGLEPSAFERLIQRVLRESGFSHVQVTGRTGDGGIDGKGILRLGGLLGFHVIFQAKRYSGSVSPSQIRDFRGAMVGRADKGLFITTGTFTKEAIKEATRDGAPPIDLIDGDLFIDKLKEFSLGVETQRVEVEKVIVNPDWFSGI
ncbi:MAG: restriction endonuclease [Nitrospira sp.]|nr:restriction endonuclease [Nitrospira sp.]